MNTAFQGTNRRWHLALLLSHTVLSAVQQLGGIEAEMTLSTKQLAHAYGGK